MSLADGDWDRRRTAIAPTLQFPEGSKERADAIRVAATTAGVSERSIREWIANYVGTSRRGRGKGIEGLCRPVRADKGQDRTIISRAWDAGVSFPDEAKREIRAKMVTEVKSLWAAGTSGRRHVARLATTELVKLTRAAGLDLPDADMLRLCALPEKFAMRYRRHKLLAIKDKDAKQFADKYEPRIRRTREGLLPMEIVVADVHHLDIYFRRGSDGALATPKAITWYDLATNRAFMTLEFLEAREGIRQEHVVRSFIAMTQAPNWGMPGALYLDNGGEFKKLTFVDDAMKLARWANAQGFSIGYLDDATDIKGMVLAGRRSMIIKARPYNAAAKPVEGLFSVLERGPFAMVPGWIGGNRMTKKTHNVGKEPEPFDGTEEEFRAAINAALDYHHTTPQDGTLTGRSPNQAVADAIAAGWRPTGVDPDALGAAFATTVERAVKQGHFKHKRRWYYHDALLAIGPDAKVQVRIPVVGDGQRLAVLDDDDTLLCIAAPDRRYGFTDRDGAKERGRRKKVQNKALSDMREEVHHVDLVASMREAAALHPSVAAVQPASVIHLTGAEEAIAAATRDLGPTPEATEDERRIAEQMSQYARIAELNARRRAAAG